MCIREYEAERDLEAAKRIWFEIGWLENDAEAAYLGDFIAAGRAFVADVEGGAECLVLSMPGSMRFQSENLRLSAVMAVTTSRIARKLGLAGRLTAYLLAADAHEGFEVAALGMFEQGFYDRLGFGTGPYEHELKFDPATLLVDRPFRVPKRLTLDDWEAIHAAMCGRLRGHGGCVIDPPRALRSELGWRENGFGLGYYDGPEGRLSHFFFCSGKGENGPYKIEERGWQTHEQLLELLALVKSLGDQVSSIEMLEIGEIQFQDLLRQPFRTRRNSEGSKFENSSEAFAYWQIRILDLPACLEKTSLPGRSVRFNLLLTDPIADFLPADAPWRGIGGDWVVTLGPESSAVRGREEGLAQLEASVGAFTRLWFGIRPASSLSVTDRLQGPGELLAALDETIRLPSAHLGWDF